MLLKTVEQLGVPTSDEAVADVTGLPPEEVRQGLVELGADYLHVKPRQQDGVSVKVEVHGIEQSAD